MKNFYKGLFIFFIMVMYSHSKLSTFEQCPLKFKYKYLDKIVPAIERSIEAHLGSAVHAALEWLYVKVKDENVVPSLDEVIVFYTEEWKKDFSEDIVIVNERMSAQDYFNKGVEFLIPYYIEHQPFKDNTLEVEKKIVLDLDSDGKYKIQGFIDRLVYNLRTKEYEIHDYKTANTLPSLEKLERDRQLALYSLAVKALYGNEQRVKLVWHFLAHNKRVHLRKTDEELMRLKEETLEKIKSIEETRDFPPVKSALCKWCEYHDVCPAWGNAPPKSKDEVQKETAAFTEELSKYPTLSKYIKK